MLVLFLRMKVIPLQWLHQLVVAVVMVMVMVMVMVVVMVVVVVP